MESPLVLVRRQIETIWEALTPPTVVARPYRLIDDARQERKLMNHRAFWFGAPRGFTVTDMASANMTRQWSQPARVHLDVGGRKFHEVGEEVANETSLLANAIDRVTSWPLGVDFVMVAESTHEITEANHIDLMFEIAVRTQEL
jgi:hypothetical protein